MNLPGHVTLQNASTVSVIPLSTLFTFKHSGLPEQVLVLFCFPYPQVIPLSKTQVVNPVHEDH